MKKMTTKHWQLFVDITDMTKMLTRDNIINFPSYCYDMINNEELLSLSPFDNKLHELLTHTFRTHGLYDTDILNTFRTDEITCITSNKIVCKIKCEKLNMFITIYIFIEPGKLTVSTKDLTTTEINQSIKKRLKCRPEYICNYYVMCEGTAYFRNYFKLFWQHILEEGTGVPCIYTKSNCDYELYQLVHNTTHTATYTIQISIYYIDDYISEKIEQQLEKLLQVEEKNAYFANIFYGKCTYGYSQLLENPKYKMVTKQLYTGLFENYFDWFNEHFKLQQASSDLHGD